MAESFVILSSAIMWKVERVPNELGDLAEEMSKQDAEGASRFLLAALVERKRRRINQTKGFKQKGARYTLLYVK